MSAAEIAEKYRLALSGGLRDRLESVGAHVLNALGPIPKHIAFCMDGNRRFAKLSNLAEGGGHVAGFEAMLRVLVACYRIGVKTVTVYAFSIENFNRAPEESDALFDLVRTKLWDLVKNRDSAMRRLGWKIRFPGHRSMLEADLLERIDEIESATAQGNSMVVNICAPYTSRDDLTHALTVAATTAAAGAPVEPAAAGEREFVEWFSQSRYMAPSEPLDILVRTSGETRFSDFMTWEAASHCSIDFVPQLWPDYKPWHLYCTVARWQVRELRRRRLHPWLSMEDPPVLVSVSQKKNKNVEPNALTQGDSRTTQTSGSATSHKPVVVSTPGSSASRRLQLKPRIVPIGVAYDSAAHNPIARIPSSLVVDREHHDEPLSKATGAATDVVERLEKFSFEHLNPPSAPESEPVAEENDAPIRPPGAPSPGEEARTSNANVGASDSAEAGAIDGVDAGLDASIDSTDASLDPDSGYGTCGYEASSATITGEAAPLSGPTQG